MPTVEAIVEPCINECDLSFVLVGERLRELGEARKLSRRNLEEATGISRFQTARIENGRGIPDLETLKRYALALEVPLFALLYEVPQADGDLLGLSGFAALFSRLSGGERNLLRCIALGLRRKDVQTVISNASTP
jgi:transcriptional regulator with XRE-family HTH domain